MEGLLESHDAKTHWPVADIRCPGLGHSVVIDVDDVVEHAHRHCDRLFKLVGVKLKTTPGERPQVLDQVNRAEITDRDL